MIKPFTQTFDLNELLKIYPELTPHATEEAVLVPTATSASEFYFPDRHEDNVSFRDRRVRRCNGWECRVCRHAMDECE